MLRAQPTHGAEPNLDHPHMVGLEAWYTFNEGGGRRLYDSSGWDRTADIQVAGWEHGEMTAVDFPFNSTNRIICPLSVPRTIKSTWSVWLKTIPFSSGNDTVIAFDTNPNGDGALLMSVSTSGMSFHSSDGMAGQDLGLSSSLVGTGLVNIALVREGDAITGGYKGYLNGVLTGVRNTGTYGSDLSGTGPITIGVREFPGQGGSYIQQYNGPIMGVKIYNRALGEDELVDQFVNPFGPFDLRQPLPFPPTGLSPVQFNIVGRGRISSAKKTGSFRIGGAK